VMAIAVLPLLHTIVAWVLSKVVLPVTVVTTFPKEPLSSKEDTGVVVLTPTPFWAKILLDEKTRVASADKTSTFLKELPL